MNKNATSFSERNGYVIPEKIFIREKLTPELITAICNSLELLRRKDCLFYYNLEKYMWCKVFNNKLKDFDAYTEGYKTVSFDYIENPEKLWYEKLDYIEIIIAYAKQYNEECCTYFVEQLNSYFKSLHFAYRIVNGQIKEILPEEEDDDKLISAPIPVEGYKSIRTQLKSFLLFYFC